MTQQEIEDKYNKSITALKSLEQILKSLDATYDLHITRLSWLKHLADCCNDLRRTEVENLKAAQQTAAVQYAQQQHIAKVTQEQVAQQQPSQESLVQQTAAEEVVKKSRKKAE